MLARSPRSELKFSHMDALVYDTPGDQCVKSAEYDSRGRVRRNEGVSQPTDVMPTPND